MAVAAAAVASSMIAPAVPACSWSSTATPRPRLASSPSRPATLRCAATMAAAMPPEHSARTLAFAAPPMARTASSAATMAPP